MARPQGRGFRSFLDTPGKKTLLGSDHCLNYASTPEQAYLARKTARSLLKDLNTFWKAILEEAERTAAGGDTRKLSFAEKCQPWCHPPRVMLHIMLFLVFRRSAKSSVAQEERLATPP